MKNKRTVKLRSRFAAFCLVLSILATSSMFTLASTAGIPAEILVSGHAETSGKSTVTLNGEEILSGRTFFSSGVISTTHRAATINIGKLGRVNMSSNSTIRLSFTENTISGEVISGQAVVLNNDGVTVHVKNLSTEEQAASSKAKKGAGFWVPVAIIAGAAAGVVLFLVFRGDDEGQISLLS